MSSLRQYQRDLELSSRLGNPELCLPQEQELVDMVAQHLCTGQSPTPTQAQLVFARWKPDTAILGSWTVSFDDGSQHCISWKSYAGAKARDVEASFRADDFMRQATKPMLPCAFLPERAGLLTRFPADRVLRGAARALDMRRSGRRLDDAQLWPGKVMRRQSSSIELLRYKPERRAVLSMHAKLKATRQGPRVSAGERRLGVRLLAPQVAEQVIENRLAGPPDVLPKLLYFEPEVGLLIEEWVEGQPIKWNDLSLATPSARLLLGLHQEVRDKQPLSPSRAGAMQLLSRVPGLAETADKIPSLGETPSSHWIHGDFHADQVTRCSDGLRLLDADGLRPGAPEEDFASWAADCLQQEPSRSLHEAIAPLLEGYATRAHSLDLEFLAHLAAEQLIHRAAAGIRRLQAGAEHNARLLLERAQQLIKEKTLR